MDERQVTYLSKEDLADLLKEDPMGLSATTASLLEGGENQAREDQLYIDSGEGLFPVHFENEANQEPAAHAPVPPRVPDLGPARDGLMAQLARLNALAASVTAEAPERADIVADVRAALERIQDQLTVEVDELERGHKLRAGAQNETSPNNPDPPHQEDVAADSDNESVKSTIWCDLTTLLNPDDSSE